LPELKDSKEWQNLLGQAELSGPELPAGWRAKALVFTDDLAAYAAGLEKGQHQTEDKKQATKMERWNNTLRQRCNRLVKKTLSFSKSWQNHFLAVPLLLVNLNLEIE